MAERLAKRLIEAPVMERL